MADKNTIFVLTREDVIECGEAPHRMEEEVARRIGHTHEV